MRERERGRDGGTEGRRDGGRKRGRERDVEAPETDKGFMEEAADRREEATDGQG